MIVFVVLIAEGAARLTLFALPGFRDVHPPDDFALSERQLEILDAAMAGRTWNRKYDPNLGWTMTPGFNRRGQTINSAGLCSAREYSINKPDSILRIAAFGESNTEAADVPTVDAWPTILERGLRDTEVLNFAVGGYGPDQCWLRYRLEGKKYHPDIVLICFMTENINRIVNVFRPFYTGGGDLPFTKPRFFLEGDSLRLFPNPIDRTEDLCLLKDPTYRQQLGKLDFWYGYRYGSPWIPPWVRTIGLVKLGLTASYQARLHYYDKRAPLMPNGQYDTATDAYQLLWRILEGFYRDVEAEGARPLIFVQVPPDMMSDRREHQKLVHAPLLEDLCAAGMHHLDHAAAIDTLGPEFTLDQLWHGHPTPLGNDLEAEAVIRRLLQLGWVDHSRVLVDPLAHRYTPDGV